MTVPKTSSSADGASSAQRQAAGKHAARRKRAAFLGGVVVVALLAVVALLYTGRDSGSAATPGALPAIHAAQSTPDPAIPLDGRTMGDPNAKVTVIEWGDYQCPFCANFATTIEPQLVADYVKTGKVKFEFRAFSFLGDDSVRAAEGAACALDQGTFWAFHHAVYANHLGENVDAYTGDRLKDIARQIGLDAKTFDSCLDSHAHKQEVLDMAKEARTGGVTSTPSFVVNGKLTRFRDYATLKQDIDAALAAAGA